MGSFESWLEAVDRCFIRVTGLDRDSWPDQDYWDMFDAGDTPLEATIAAIENEYGEEGLEAFGLAVE
ncbi:MAG: hypothetical protein ACO387_03520 [Flavobacteriaceae bacterium]